MSNDLAVQAWMNLAYFCTAMQEARRIKETASTIGLDDASLMEDALRYAQSMAKFRSHGEENPLKISAKDFLTFWRKHEGDARYAAK